MANVKISELPSIDTIQNDDVLIINDTSSSTTCKTPVSKFTRLWEAITITPYDGFSYTGTITATATVLMNSLLWLHVAFQNLSLTNTTSANKAVEFTVTGLTTGTTRSYGQSCGITAAENQINNLTVSSGFTYGGGRLALSGAFQPNNSSIQRTNPSIVPNGTITLNGGTDIIVTLV